MTAAFAAALLLVLALAGTFVYLRVSNDLNSTLDDGLRSRTDDLTRVVSTTGGAPSELGGGELVGGEESASQILAPDGRLLASTLDPGVGPMLDSAEIERAASGEVWVDEREVPGIDGDAKILARPVDSAHGRFIVVAGSTTEDRRETLAGIARSFLVGTPLAILLASGLGYLLAGSSLAPVGAMRRRADEITLERSGERLPLPRADDEIHQLGETLNSMLDRIEASLDRERVFVADASHELRTPLSILRAELELAGRPGRSPDQLRTALRSAAEEVDRLSQLAEDLLVIARSDQGRLPIKREATDIDEVLGRVRERFAPRARERGRAIAVEVPNGLRGELDPLRVEQALGNLVDNALRHGEGEVRLTAAREDGSVLLDVSDDGPGFPRGFEGEAFDRFTRADGRAAGGAGLGLAIARAIALAHGGGVRILSSEGPGATVRISLPATR